MLRPVRRGAGVAGGATSAGIVALAVVAFAGAAAAQESLPCREPDPGESLEQWVNRCYGDIAATDGDGGDAGCVLRGVPWFGTVDVRCLAPALGFWSNAAQCYLTPADPQPPADHPVWDGHSPDDGLVYTATCPAMQGVDGRDWRDWPQLRFFPTGDGVVGDLVAEAIGRLDLAGPDIHSAPDPDGAGLVGLPVWLWTPQTESTWGPQRLRLPALGWDLVVEATVDRIEYDMGDGNTAPPCHTPGTPYHPSYGARPSPDCGYHGYAEPSRHLPGGVYQVTATAYWRVDWWFDGTTVRGSRTTTRESSTTLRVHELQVVSS